MSFQFDPAVDAHAGEPPLIVHPSQTAPNGGLSKELPAWAWLCKCDGRFVANGRLECRATYFIENIAAPTLHITAPSDSRLIEVTVNGNALERTSVQGQGVVEIPLPEGQRFPIVSAMYTRDCSRWLFVQRVALEPPQLDVPVLSRQTSGWLPAAYDGWSATLAEGADTDSELTWSQRLFGPFGSERHEARFEPWSSGSWKQLLPSLNGENRRIAGARSILLHLNTAAATEDGMTAWNSVVTHFAESLKADRPSRRLFMDGPALERAGILATTTLHVPKMDDKVERAGALLSEARLAVLIHDEGVVLTSLREAVQLGAQISPDFSGGTAWIQPGPLANAIHQMCNVGSDPVIAAASGVAPGWFPAEIWGAMANHEPSPWPAASGEDSNLLPNFGWKAYPLSSAASSSPGLWIVNHHTRQALCWSLFILAAAWGAMELRRRKWLRSAVAVISVGGALLLPAIFAPLFTAIFWGLAVGKGFRWLRWFRASESASREQPSESRRPTGAVVAGAILPGLLLLAQCLVGRAEEPAGPPATEQEALYRVFIPVDDKQHLVGDRYWIPAALYDELDRRTQARSETGAVSNWWFESAEYSATVARDTATAALSIPEVKAVYRFYTTDKATRVTIPWAGSGAQLLAEPLTLDDRPTQLLRPKDEGDLTLEAASPGLHRLEIHWRPALRSGTRDGGFDLAVPAAAVCRLALSAPPDLTDVRFPTARGGLDRDPAKGIWTAQFGATSRLSVRWSDAAHGVSAEPIVQAEEISWLKILPGSVLLDLKYKLNIKEGRLREFRIAVDPRLRLLPTSASDTFSATQSEPGANELSTITFHFPRGIRDNVTVEATLLLTGTPVVGNLHLPDWRPQGVTVQSRMLGVSVDPDLHYDEQVRTDVPAAATSDFLTAWGGGEGKPTFCRRLPLGDVKWNLTLRPQDSTLSIKEQTAWFLGAGHAHLTFAATATSVGGYRFQYRLRVPRNLTVNSVTVREENADMPVRWSRSEPGQVTVFLPSAATNEQLVVLNGDLPSPLQGDWTFPEVHLENARVSAARAYVFRLPSVLADRVRWSGLKEEPLAEALLADAAQGRWLDKDWLGRGRLIGAWQGAEAGTGTVALAKNAPRTEITQLLALETDGEGWQAVLDCQLQVTGGKLDELRFAIPEEWSGPFEINPPAQFEIRPLPGEELKQLWLRPRVPLEGSQRITIRGPLSSDERARLPEVMPLRADRVTRLVALPALVNLQHLAWDVRNLTTANWPRAFAEFPGRESYKLYRAEGEHVDAVLKTVEPLSGAPRIRLADYVVACTPDAVRGSARFDVLPVGAATCLVEMPDPLQLLDVTVDGAPAIVRPTEGRRWEIEIGPTQLPRRVRVAFSGPATWNSAQTVRLGGPVLVDLPVDRTLWTVFSAAPPATGSLPENTVITSLRGDAYRLEATAASIENGFQRITRDAGEVTPGWADSWVRDGVAIRRGIERRRLLESRGNLAKVESDLRVAEQHWSGVTKLLGVTSARAVSETKAISLGIGEAPPGSDERDPALVAIFDKAMPSIEYRALGDYAHNFANNFITQVGRWLLTLALLAAAIELYRRGSIAEWCRRYPLPTAALAGIAWWVWLSPSGLGLLFALGCVVAGWVLGHRPRRVPTGSRSF